MLLLVLYLSFVITASAIKHLLRVHEDQLRLIDSCEARSVWVPSYIVYLQVQLDLRGSSGGC